MNGIAPEPWHAALATRTASVGQHSRVRLLVRCRNIFERCRTTLALTARRRHRRRSPATFGRAAISLAPGSSKHVTVTLNDRARRLLAAAPDGHLTVRARLGAEAQALELVG